MCSGKHICPICDKSYKCIVEAKHGEPVGTCMDEVESFCDPCQETRFDEIEIYLRNEGRL